MASKSSTYCHRLWGEKTQRDEILHDKPQNARNNDKLLLNIPYSITYSTGVAVVGSWDVAKNGNRYNWKGWSHQTYANRVFIVRSYWSPPLLYYPRIYSGSDQRPGNVGKRTQEHGVVFKLV